MGKLNVLLFAFFAISFILSVPKMVFWSTVDTFRGQVELKDLPDSSRVISSYTPSHLESLVTRYSQSELQYDVAHANECNLYRNQTESLLYSEFHEYTVMMEKYAEAARSFLVDVKDIRRLLSEDKRSRVCNAMDDLLDDSFPKEKYLSRTAGGYVEPLLPPLRHPRFCEQQRKKMRKYIFNVDYLVHDFGFICKQISRTARTVFIDLGASLEFHGGRNGGNNNPILKLVETYQWFGIKFDHYYAFERSIIRPEMVYDRIPEKLIPAFHWYNVPVNADPSSKQNPWKSILSQYEADDFVVVKVDIDMPSVEVPLVHQLLAQNYADLVDHFYFEFHVQSSNMAVFWGENTTGTLHDSLSLFTALREHGVAAHSWI
mmetsp:Transcript_35959/g.86925  ORF Transcript_35959/g.86925 Transcript_35959/m.86925 type:complete len:374 (-) Transcript_35959:355-1476(-)|eukprot:CAMPEP_0113623278 /NCGR_PEP_ID=MMETSP0017_2-20120614/11967_1 /TAXON_ID=2856 /ORGANISM="Cylindrotheca closterium" /LENGTH=373 /DNA_ID=CAMNT_0000533207 /DNA_START=131 /DNA_END=1252 /DNA_ORIENTATION=+ /assembly_acc=CAM_ASM_000147